MVDWLQSLLLEYGYWAIFWVLFLNNLGLPAPGNSLLLGAGLLVGVGDLSFWATAGVATGACFMGTNCGYWLGRRHILHSMEKIRWLRLTHTRVRHIGHFFKRYGSKGVFFARFVALIHPFIGILAGMGKTPIRPFLFYNLAGSGLYSLLYILAGDTLGRSWGFHKLWMLHTALYLFLLALVLVFLNHFWRHSIHTFFGHTFYKRKGWGFWGK